MFRRGISQKDLIVLAVDTGEVLGSLEVEGWGASQNASDDRAAKILVRKPLHRVLRRDNKR